MCKLNILYIIILAKCNILLALIYLEYNQIRYNKLFSIKSGSWLFLNWNHKVICILRAILILLKKVNRSINLTWSI